MTDSTEEEVKATLLESIETLKKEYGWTAQEVSDFIEENN